jgi:hypothetical protein
VGNAITACINGIKVLQASDGTYDRQSRHGLLPSERNERP